MNITTKKIVSPSPNALDPTPLFPSISPLQTQYQASRAALAAGEVTGASGEGLIEELFRVANIAYHTDYGSRTLDYPIEVQAIASGFTCCISDGYAPEYRLHVEVRSGEGKETDSIDKKTGFDVMAFVTFGIGDKPHPASTLDTWKPMHRLFVQVGKKQYSGYVRIAQEFVRQVCSGEQPMTETQRERAHRLHFVNVVDMTPRWLDSLRAKIDRYNAALQQQAIRKELDRSWREMW